MTKTCLRRNRSGSNSGSSCHFYTYGSTRGFFPLVHALSLVRPFGDRRVPVRTARGATARRWAGEQTAKATGTAVCGESYRLRPAKVTQPSLVGGRRRPCLCLVPPPDAPAHTGRAHVTLTFGSQVYYQYYVFGISYYDGVSRYVRLRLGIPSRLPPACPRRGSLLKPSARALQPLHVAGFHAFTAHCAHTLTHTKNYFTSPSHKESLTRYSAQSPQNHTTHNWVVSNFQCRGSITCNWSETGVYRCNKVVTRWWHRQRSAGPLCKTGAAWGLPYLEASRFRVEPAGTHIKMP